jgi:hypothetical protein
LKLSVLDDDEYTALHSQIYGFGKYGYAIHDCNNCSEMEKDKKGCGFVDEFSGTAFWKSGIVDYKKTCPGFYRNSQFLQSFLSNEKFRKNLGSHYKFSNRLLLAFNFFDFLMARKNAEETKNREQRNKSKNKYKR